MAKCSGNEKSVRGGDIMREIYLVFLSSRGRAVVRIPNDENMRAIIGRGEFYKIKVTLNGEDFYPDILGDASVSKRHAQIFWKNGYPYIQDLGSLNGTKVEGLMLPEWRPRGQSKAVPLHPGMKILFGAQTLASVESHENTLTIIEGQKVMLSDEEMDILSKNSKIKIHEGNNPQVEVVDVKEDKEISVKNLKIRIKKVPENIFLQMNLLRNLEEIYDAYEKKDVDNIFAYIKILREEYNNILKEIGEEKLILFMNAQIDEDRLQDLSSAVMREFIRKVYGVKKKLWDKVLMINMEEVR